MRVSFDTDIVKLSFSVENQRVSSFPHRQAEFDFLILLQ